MNEIGVFIQISFDGQNPSTMEGTKDHPAYYIGVLAEVKDGWNWIMVEGGMPLRFGLDQKINIQWGDTYIQNVIAEASNYEWVGERKVYQISW